MESNATVAVGGSFRDPAGFVYRKNGVIYRQVNPAGLPAYRALMDSGLYAELLEGGYIIPHKEVSLDHAASEEAALVLQPEALPFVSYPYEWCFSALRDAALLTLDIQRRALRRGVTLKDATAFNVQFRGTRPVFIDTLSFETYAGGPWNAYQQFCQHFLAPLALRQRVHPALSSLARVHLHGVPLDLASRLLPRRTWLQPSLLMHIHLHAKAQRRYQDAISDSTQEKLRKARTMTGAQLERLVQHLVMATEALALPEHRTVWTDYYDETNYTDSGMAEKIRLVNAAFDRISRPLEVIHDFGANTGRFSREAAKRARHVVAFDFDETVINRLYQSAGQGRDAAAVLPLVMDLENPSPGLGWANRERDSLTARGGADACLALALIHHLAIGNNVPLGAIADFFAGITTYLVIEFVPKSDSQVKRLLANRADFFADYHEPGFEQAFRSRFDIVEKWPVGDSVRTLYLMKRKATN